MKTRIIGFFAALLLALAPGAEAAAPVPAVVVMHGKGGRPTAFVADLASSLEARGFLVANLEMPWSGARDYDAGVAAAETQISAALDALRARGASHAFVAGHSQGGIFALHYGGRHRVDGIIAIAPGGNVASPLFRDKLGESLQEARRLVEAGRGGDKARLRDYEGGRGVYPIVTTPAHYLEWFEPAGAMNERQALRGVSAETPVLYIVPTGDYPSLLRLKAERFAMLARHPLTRLHEPAASHLQAPSASSQEIGDWILEVVRRGQP